MVALIDSLSALGKDVAGYAVGRTLETQLAPSRSPLGPTGGEPLGADKIVAGRRQLRDFESQGIALVVEAMQEGCERRRELSELLWGKEHGEVGRARTLTAAALGGFGQAADRVDQKPAAEVEPKEQDGGEVEREQAVDGDAAGVEHAFDGGQPVGEPEDEAATVGREARQGDVVGVGTLVFAQARLAQARPKGLDDELIGWGLLASQAQERRELGTKSRGPERARR